MHYSELPSKSGIYRASTPAGDTYIGQAKDLSKRGKDHSKEATVGTKFQEAIDKYGHDSIQYDIVELVHSDNPYLIYEREYFHIAFEKSMGLGQLNTIQPAPFLFSIDGTTWMTIYSRKHFELLIRAYSDYDAAAIDSRISDNLRRGGVRMIGEWYMMPAPVVDVSDIKCKKNTPTPVQVSYNGGEWKSFDSYTQAAEYYGANIRKGYAPKYFEVREA